MSKREKFMEFFYVKYPEFVKRHKWGVLLAFGVFILFVIFVASGGFYKFIFSEAFAKFVLYFSEYFKFFITSV